MDERYSKAIQLMGRIYGAVLLHDMRTRFGRTYLSYLISIAWPLIHLTVILVAKSLLVRIAPIGDDPTVFAATGLLPYILCFYPARMMMTAVVQNKPLLQFPIIKPIDLIAARATLEILNAAIVAVILLGGLQMVGIEFDPNDTYEVAAAIVASIYFGTCLGLFGIVLYSVLGWGVQMAILMSLVGLYLTSGAFVSITLFPEEFRKINWYNPLFHSVEWLRSGYYGIDSYELNRLYLAAVATTFLFLGLLGERMIRGRVIS